MKTKALKKHNKIFIASIALLVPIINSTLSYSLGIENTNYSLFTLLLIYVGMGFYIWQGSLKETWKIGILVWAMTPIAVFINAAIDWFLRGIDRNLFPIEIILMLIIIPLPLAIGMVLKNVLRYEKL